MMMNNYSFRNKLKAKYFYKFLLKKCLLDMWLENVKTQHPYTRGIPQYEENHDILQLLDTCRDIDFSFNWASTPQGHGYWSNLQNEFTQEYNKLNYDFRTMKMVKLS